ncbi:MAG: TRAP transporter substrate-binding protein [Firmicutes bacterium]|nr:TRAP transporter substrate-binding protein [Bacillota bacterium]
MKTLTKVIAALLCVVMVFGLAACGGGSTPANNTPANNTTPANNASNDTPPVKAIVLKASSPAAQDAAWGLALQRMADSIKEKTGGRYQVDVYHKAALSENSEKVMTEQVYTGNLDICITPASLAASIWSAFSVPFQFDSREHVYKVLKSDIVADMCKTMEDKGMKVLSLVENGYRQITNNKHEIKVPADTHDVKLRTPQAKSSIAIAEKMGFQTVAISAGELFQALQQGTADGQENALNTIYDNKYYEVQKYLTVVNYNWSPALFGINLDLWNSLSAEDQKIFQEVFTEVADWANKKMADEDRSYIDKLKAAGMQVYECTPEDIALWKKQMEGSDSIYFESVGEELMKNFTKTVNDLR